MNPTKTSNWKRFQTVGQGGTRVPVRPPMLQTLRGISRLTEGRLNDKLAGQAIDEATARKGGMHRISPAPTGLVTTCRCGQTASDGSIIPDPNCPHIHRPEASYGNNNSPSAFKAWVKASEEHLPHPIFNRGDYLQAFADPQTHLLAPSGYTELCPRCEMVECLCKVRRAIYFRITSYPTCVDNCVPVYA